MPLGGLITSYVSTDDQKAIAMSPLGMMPPKPPLCLEETSADIKHQLRKEIDSLDEVCCITVSIIPLEDSHFVI